MRFRFTIRDLLWLTVVVALTLGLLNLTVLKPGEPAYVLGFCLWLLAFAISTRDWERNCKK